MKFRVTRPNDYGDQECIAHYDDAEEAVRANELYEELGSRVSYSVELIPEEPCKLCQGQNDHL